MNIFQAVSGIKENSFNPKVYYLPNNYYNYDIILNIHIFACCTDKTKPGKTGHVT